jgi:phage/plasmid-like protein (TIGR03299 family)
MTRRRSEPSNGHGPGDRWAFTGETPFSLNGTYLGDKDLRGTEALEAFGLNWTCRAVPQYHSTGPKSEGGVLVRSSTNAILRDGDNMELGIVKQGHDVLQNHEAIAVLDAAVESGAARIVAGGDFDFGKRVWLLADMGASTIREDARGRDDVRRMLLLHTGNDGGTSTRILPMTGRPRCNNVVVAALARHEGIIVRHTRNQRESLEVAARVVLELDKAGARSVAFLRLLADRHLSTESWTRILTALVPVPKDGSPVRAQAKWEELTALLYHGKGQDPDGERTFWDAHNAVTEYVNFHRQTRGSDDAMAQMNRWKGTVFGQGARFVASANALMAEMLDAKSLLTETETNVDAVALMNELEA